MTSEVGTGDGLDEDFSERNFSLEPDFFLQCPGRISPEHFDHSGSLVLRVDIESGHKPR